MKIWFGLAAATAAALALAPAALAIPPGGPVHCPPGYALRDGECVKIAPPEGPPINPSGRLEIAQQGADKASVHVRGWTADGDSPQTALTVRFTVDGAVVRDVVADQPRPDVGAANPQFGPNHGYDLTLPAASDAHLICAMTFNVGGGSNLTSCLNMDAIVQFDVNDIDYDLDHAQILNSQLDTLARETTRNDSSVTQSTSMQRSTSIADTHSWSNQLNLTVKLSGEAGLPLVENGRVEVDFSEQFTWGRSTTTTTTFTWNQPISVPPMSEVTGTIAVTESAIQVPYQLVGFYVYASGATTPVSLPGVYSGTNAHDLQAHITQTNLDGTPSAHPAKQAAPAFNVS